LLFESVIEAFNNIPNREFLYHAGDSVIMKRNPLLAYRKLLNYKVTKGSLIMSQRWAKCSTYSNSRKSKLAHFCYVNVFFKIFI